MALARITRPGLILIAILVSILWGCVLGERYLLRHSKMETYRALRDIRYLKFKRRAEPATHPVRPTDPPASSTRPVIG